MDDVDIETKGWSSWRYVSHDEELVRALAPYDVLHVEELGDPELPLRHTECQLAVPDVTFHVEYLFIIDFKRNDDIRNVLVILLINYKL